MAGTAILSGLKQLQTTTITGSGYTASTAYVVAIIRPSGGTTFIDVTTDGSGAFTSSFVGQTQGTVTVEVRPKKEYLGTTTPESTTSGTIGGN